MRFLTEDKMEGDDSMVSTRVSNETRTIFRQQIDHSNHEMVTTLTNHMASILNPMLRTMNKGLEKCRKVNKSKFY